jgi:hypothetical protein
VALRRVGVLVLLAGTVVLGWVLLSTTTRTASASEVCTQFDISGTWSFVVPNHVYSVFFQQDSARQLTGELYFSPADVKTFGYPPGTRFPITKGSMDGNHLMFEDTPTQPKTDGSGARVGVYNGTVTAGSLITGPGQFGAGSVKGTLYDKQAPSSSAAFSGSGVLGCIAGPAPRPLAPGISLAVAPSGSGKTPPATISPGGAVVEVGPVPAGKKEETVTVTGHNTIVDGLVNSYPSLVEKNRLLTAVDCVRMGLILTKPPIIDRTVKGGTDVVPVTGEERTLDFTLWMMACLEEVNSQPPPGKGKALDAGAAASGACPVSIARIRILSVGKRSIRYRTSKRAGRLPVAVSCRRGPNRITMHVKSRSRGKTLRALYGSRLVIGVYRSRRATRSDTVTATFTAR